jgi:hypothetical protein
MGGYLSSSDYDSKINELEKRLIALEQTPGKSGNNFETTKKIVIKPSWHADMVKEIHKRRKSIDG